MAGDKLPSRSNPSVTGTEYLVLIRAGDAITEVDRALRSLGMDAEAAGLHRVLFVTRANQTVAMVRDVGAPIATLLLARGWTAPGAAL
ncbi:hypothetical protein BH23GEM6_BH23GEM6_23790 [soil metagenome]